MFMHNLAWMARTFMACIAGWSRHPSVHAIFAWLARSLKASNFSMHLLAWLSCLADLQFEGTRCSAEEKFKSATEKVKKEEQE